VKSISTFRVLSAGYELKNDNGETHIYNLKNKKIASLPKTYCYAEVLLEDGLIGFADIPGFPGEAKAGFKDLDGKILVEPSYMINSDDGYQFPSFNGFDCMVVRDESKLAGLVDKNFNVLIPFEYDFLYSKYILGEKQGRFYMFNLRGQSIESPNPAIFKEHQNNCKGNYCYTRENHKLKIVDIEGRKVEGFDDIELKASYEQVFICAKENLYGVYDNNLTEIMPFKYNIITALAENKLLFLDGQNFKCNWLNEGEIYDLPVGFLPTVYLNKYSYKINSQFISGNFNEKTRVVNTKGETVVPFETHLLRLSYLPEN